MAERDKVENVIYAVSEIHFNIKINTIKEGIKNEIV